jgi:hypothetical protein
LGGEEGEKRGNWNEIWREKKREYITHDKILIIVMIRVGLLLMCQMKLD